MEKRRCRNTMGLIVQVPAPQTVEAGVQVGRLVEALDRAFAAGGLGTFDGMDNGGGKINIFIFDILDNNWDSAREITIGEVKKLGLLDVAIIVRSISWESDEDDWAEHEVVWPQVYSGEFSIW